MKHKSVHSPRDRAKSLIAAWLERGIVPEVERTKVLRDGIWEQFDRVWLRLGVAQRTERANRVSITERDWAALNACKREVLMLLRDGGAVVTRSVLDVPIEPPTVAPANSYTKATRDGNRRRRASRVERAKMESEAAM